VNKDTYHYNMSSTVVHLAKEESNQLGGERRCSFVSNPHPKANSSRQTSRKRPWGSRYDVPATTIKDKVLSTRGRGCKVECGGREAIEDNGENEAMVFFPRGRAYLAYIYYKFSLGNFVLYLTQGFERLLENWTVQIHAGPLRPDGAAVRGVAAGGQECAPPQLHGRR
jgi:hypothetical protein